MRPISPQYLLQVLPTLLSSLNAEKAMEVDDSTPIPADVDRKKMNKGKGKAVEKKVEAKITEEVIVEADLEELISTLDSVDCCEEVARCILGWFGSESGKSNWKIRIGEVVKEIGIGLLAQGGVSSFLFVDF